MFRDRSEAGQLLANRLKHYQEERPIVMALPRGGVPVGYEVAKALKAPLDVFIVRKIGLPWNPELGVGAIAPGIQMIDDRTLQMFGLKPEDLEETIQHEQKELERRLNSYGCSENLSHITGKTIIVVDDGIATGVTTQIAVQGIKQFHPEKLILAVPVSSSEAIEKLKASVDEVVCLEIPRELYAIGLFYNDFSQVSDKVVIELLKQASARKDIINAPS